MAKLFKNTVTQGRVLVQVRGKDVIDGLYYERHRPEETLLYELIEQHYPALVDHLAERGKGLPEYVKQEFEAYLKCGRLEHGFLRVKCESCHLERLVAFSCKKRGFCPSCGARRMAETAALLCDEVFPPVPLRQWVISFPFALRYLFAAHPKVMGKALGIVYRTIATHLIHKAGFQLKDASTGAVTLIQRFGSSLNLNIHGHLLVLDGVYYINPYGNPVFRRVKAPGRAELQALVHKISQRVGRCLEPQGLLVRDAESDWLNLEPPDAHDPMPQLLDSSITYRIAVGPQQGRKAFMLRTLAPLTGPDKASERVAKCSGFSLHAGVSCEAHQLDKRERLCR